MLISNKTKTMKGAKIAIETLKQMGVDTVFGYPGGVVLDLYDELYNQHDIKHVLVRHEQSAVHAAEGYARISGKCGVVLVTSGPGATNTVSGIVNAYLDGYPLLILTGQVFKNLIGKDAFQEANICDITKSCTKKVFQVTKASKLQETLIEAYTVAMSGKKGPVVVDLAKNIFTESAEYKDLSIEKQHDIINQDADISRILNRILSSERLVIVAGGGVNHSGAEDELFKFVKTLNLPVVDTMMGLGAYPQNDKNYLGMLGIFGDNAANQVLKDADLIFSIGARFNDRITCKFSQADLADKIIQLDINKNEISRVFSPIDAIVGDAKNILNAMNQLLADNQVKNFNNWIKQALTLKNSNIIRQKTTNMLHSFEVFRKLEEFAQNKNLIFTSEVGQHQLWAVQNLTFNKDRKILVSGGSGTMGFGFPAAIGASIANPKTSVVCITGDGSFQMGLHELATCADYNLNIKIMILNNGYLGMVRQLQEKSCEGRYSETKISNPDFVKLADSYGIKAKRVCSINEIDEALNSAFSTTGPFIVEFCIEPMELL